MPSTTNASLITGLAHRGVVLMHLVGGSDIFLVAATGTDRAATTVHLGEGVKISKVEVLFDTQLVAYD